MRTRQLTIATWLASCSLFRLQAAVVGAIVSGFCGFTPAWAGSPHMQAQNRVLLCPEKFSIGQIYLLKRVNLTSQSINTQEAIIRTTAQGRVTMPQKGWLLLVGDYALSDGLKPLEKLKSDDLQILRLSKLTFKDSELKYLTGLSGLQRIELDSTDINDEALKTIAKLPNLVYLTLARTLVTGKTLADLAPLKKLTDLQLGHNLLCKGNLNGAAALPSLRTLRVQACQLRNKDLESISRIKTLESLTLHENKLLSDDGVKHLAKLTNLEFLDIGRTAITASGIKALKHCPLSKLRIETGQFTRAQKAQITEIFPKIQIVEENTGHEMDPTLFAPLH
jgi:hypothetical protein